MTAWAISAAGLMDATIADLQRILKEVALAALRDEVTVEQIDRARRVMAQVRQQTDLMGDDRPAREETEFLLVRVEGILAKRDPRTR